MLFVLIMYRKELAHPQYKCVPLKIFWPTFFLHSWNLHKSSWRQEDVLNDQLSILQYMLPPTCHCFDGLGAVACKLSSAQILCEILTDIVIKPILLCLNCNLPNLYFSSVLRKSYFRSFWFFLLVLGIETCPPQTNGWFKTCDQLYLAFFEAPKFEHFSFLRLRAFSTNFIDTFASNVPWPAIRLGPSL